MKVAVSARVLNRNTGGNTSYSRHLYRNLRSQGVRVHPLEAPWDATNHQRTRSLSYAIAEGVYWPTQLSSADYDLLHYPADTGPAKRGNLPQVVTIHGAAMLHLDAIRKPLDLLAWKWRVRRAAAASDAVITVSEHSRRDVSIVTGIPEERIRVIRHGIDHVRFHPDQTGDAETLLNYKLPERFLLYLGNLEPKKNLVNLVRAMEQPALRKAAVPLVVAGRPTWNSHEILRAVQESPHVRYLGPVPSEHVAPLMRTSTAFVFPSAYEGWGLPPLEAMACGTPTVTSDRGALPEVLGDATKRLNGTSPEAIADGIHDLLTDRTGSVHLSRAGLARAASFTWDASASLHLQVFKEVTGAS